jgi:hypothetical protein
MAKTKLTVLDVAGIIGSISTVTTSTRGETTLISRKVGHQVATPAQEPWRAAFAQADAHWKYLSLADRQAWRTYRRWQHINGYSQYMRINITRVHDGLPIIENPANIP